MRPKNSWLYRKHLLTFSSVSDIFYRNSCYRKVVEPLNSMKSRFVTFVWTRRGRLATWWKRTDIFDSVVLMEILGIAWISSNYQKHRCHFNLQHGTTLEDNRNNQFIFKWNQQTFVSLYCNISHNPENNFRNMQIGTKMDPDLLTPFEF